MYEQFYNLSCRPFETLPDEKFLWLGENQTDALAAMRYGIWENKGFVLLTGEEGTGKTTLANALAGSLGDNVERAIIVDPALDRLDFYNAIAAGFGLERDFTSKVQFLIQFSHFLHKAFDEGKKVALIVDNSEKLSQEMLEELRLLSNIEKAETKLINIVFIGRPEFNEMLVLPKNRAVRQRLALHVELEPLNLKETEDYIRHRLQLADAPDKLFAAKAVNTVHRIARGIPRNINVLCAYSLVAGAVRGKKTIDHRLVEECLAKLGLPAHPAREELAELSADERSLGIFRGKFVANGGIMVNGVVGYNFEEGHKSSRIKYGIGAICLVAFGSYLWWSQHPQMETTAPPPSAGQVQQPSELVHTSPAVKMLEKNPSVISERQAAELKNAILENAFRQEAPAEETGSEETTAVVEKPEAAAPVETVPPVEASPEPVAAATVQDTEPGVAPPEIAPAGEVQPGSHPEVVIVSTEPEPAKPDAGEVVPSQETGVTTVQDGDGAEKQADQTVALPSIKGEKFILPLQANSIKLTREGRNNLKEMLALLAPYPHARLLVKGYVSAKTNSPENIKLSEDRAANVKDFLVAEGVSGERMDILGMGNQEPLASNSTREGRAKNRRVEIVILSE